MPEPGRLDALLLVLVPSGLAALCILAVLLIAGVLIAAASWLKGANHSFSLWTASEPWLLVLASSGCVGLVMTFLLFVPQIRAFSFDRSTRMLTYTESGFGRNPLVIPVRFERITSVRACLPTTWDKAGYFQVCVDDGHGVIRSIQLGSRIPIATLRQHLDWLRQDIPEHIESTLQFDT